MTGVSKYYRRADGIVPVLNNLNLVIPDQSVTALTAISGWGKSTLALILMQIEPWDDGEIYCSGQPLRSIPPRRLQRRIQFVQQNPLLSVHPMFPVSKILSEPLTVTGLSKAVIKQKIVDILEMLELSPTLLTRLPGDISGGELQRVTLGRALLLEPEYIIMDEPFSALDRDTAGHLAQTIGLALKHTGTGALLLSPQPDTVSTLADEMINVYIHKK